MRLKDLGEFNFIDRVSKGVKLSDRVVKGIGDDAAVLKYTKDKFLLLTCDMLIEGRHFYRDIAPELIGRKALSCSISDIAAMGGVPKCCVISVALPSSLDVRYVDGLYRGIKSSARKFNIDLVGGDTVSSEKIIIDVALLGEVEKENLALRSGAEKKDAIFVTGSIGGSKRGKHLRFIPRLKEARFLVENFKVNSMIDISDGLIADLGHILKESRFGAVIYEKDIPLSKDAGSFDSAIRDGEDFELVFTVPLNQASSLIKLWPFKTRLSRIGEICDRKKGFCLVRRNNRVEQIEPKGFTHF